MQIGFYFDQTRCIGCHACVVACKDWHNVPAGPASWARVKTIHKGRFPDLFVAHLFMPCYHCAEPACVSICPAGAIYKREQDGIVVVNRKECLGQESCGLCLQNCPYEAPQFGTEEDAKMQKCDFCLDRLTENKKPVCVDACPLRALDAGPIEELKKIYGHINKAESFVYSREVAPSTIFNPKRDSKNYAIHKIVIVP